MDCDVTDLLSVTVCHCVWRRYRSTLFMDCDVAVGVPSAPAELLRLTTRADARVVMTEELGNEVLYRTSTIRYLSPGHTQISALPMHYPHRSLSLGGMHSCF